MVYMYHPHTGRFEQSARSTLRASTVGPFGGRGHRASTVGPYVGGGYHVSRRSYDDDILYSPSRMYHRPYDTTGNEYATHGQINRELIMSTSAMEDNYDITNKSRARDRDVLAAANRAIVDTEIHSQPKYAVAARRAARCQSTPPAPAHYSRSEVLVARARAGPNFLRYSVPPAFPAPKRQPKSRLRVNVNPRYRNRVPVRSARFVVVKPRDRSPDTEIEEQRRAPLSLLAYLRSLQVAQLNRNRIIARPRYNVHVRPALKKAALLGSKVEALMPERKRRPKSSYAQARVRNMERDRRVSGEPEAPVFVGETTSLKAHRPVRNSYATKAHWDVDGIKRPNIMSMEKRLDTLVSPDDLMICPRSLGAVKNQLRDVHLKLDRHKQLMDRYLVTDTGLSSDDMQVLAASKAHLGARAV